MRHSACTFGVPPKSIFLALSIAFCIMPLANTKIPLDVWIFRWVLKHVSLEHI